MMKKYFSSGFFFNLKRKFSAFQRNQLELLGMSARETACQQSSELPLSTALSTHQTAQQLFPYRPVLPTKTLMDFHITWFTQTVLENLKIIKKINPLEGQFV